MASTPTQFPNPQAGAPQPGAPQASPQSPQANPLQQTLGKLVMILRQLGTQNTVIQPELQDASEKLVAALQKASQASQGAPAQSPAPPQQT